MLDTITTQPKTSAAARVRGEAERLFSIHYPEDWIAPVNPAHEEATRSTERWLSSLGVLDSDAASEKFRSLRPGWYGGSPFPSVPPSALDVITRFVTLWIFYDDVLEVETIDSIAEMAAAVRGEPSERPTGSAHKRGFWELGRHFRERMSRRWLTRFSARFCTWIKAVEAERRLVERMRSSYRTPTVVELIAHRTINVGMYPTICFIEYARGRELDDEIRADCDLARAEDLASGIVGIHNDLFGFHKDRMNRWVNLVASAAAEDDAPVSSNSFARVVRLHDHMVAELVDVSRDLTHRWGDRVQPWCEDLARIVGGFARWHASAKRYATVYPLPSGETVELRVG